MNTMVRRRVIRAMARLTHIDPEVALSSKRHNPILDREIHIEEELINLKESLESLATASDSLRDYPKMYQYIAREKRAIMKHCFGLVVRMMHGWALPRPYTKDDIDFAVRRLIQLIVSEAQRAGKRLDEDVLDAFRPFLTVRQRLALRDFGLDLVMQATQLNRASALIGKLPLPRLK
jgi:hypothetical protein